MKLIPKSVFLTTGIGHHEFELESFEEALRSAGIEKFNLVTVSSILPPNCKMVTKEEGLAELAPGEIVFCVLSRISSNERDRKLGAAVGCAFPKNPEVDHGYISEHHGFGLSRFELASHTKAMAADMFETFRMEAPEKTISANETFVKELGQWTTVIAAAVFTL